MKQSITYLSVLVSGLAAFSSAEAAIVYVDAAGGSGGNTVQESNSSATAWFTSTDSATDGLWTRRTTGPAAPLANDTGFIGNLGENAPMLVTTATAATPGLYDVYLYYGSKTGTGENNWQIQGGLSSSSLTLFNNSNGIQVNDSGDPITPLSGDRRYRSYLGTATVGLDGNLSVYVDDVFVSGTVSDPRSVYDGIGYELIPEPSAVAMLTAGMGCLLLRRRR